MALTDRDRAILDFERCWWLDPGPKRRRIEEQFELSSSRYYQLLGELVDDDAAMAYDPLVVRRLQRARAQRRRSRLAGRAPQTWESR